MMNEGQLGVPGIQAVVDSDLCIACGACVYACPNDVVSPVFNDQRGAHEVEITTTQNCPDCPAPCESVCPSIRVDFVALQKSRQPESVREGALVAVDIGYSPKFQTDGVSSSGGILRAIIEDALRSGKPVLCLCETGLSEAPQVIRDEEELAKVPGSIYHSVSFVSAIALLKELETPCVLVALPCQLEGILKYAELHPGICDKIGLAVGIVCGWMYSSHALAMFAEFKGMSETVETARYRGEGRIGKLVLKGSSNQQSFRRTSFSSFSEQVDYRASFSRYTNRLRCRLCENHTNVLADIAVGDAWLARLGKDKQSLIITRTEIGRKVLERLCSSKAIRIESGSYADVLESQSEALVWGTSARQLSHFIARSGCATPPIFDFGDGRPRLSGGVLKNLGFTIEMRARSMIQNRRFAGFRRFYWTRSVLNSPFHLIKAVTFKFGRLLRWEWL